MNALILLTFLVGVGAIAIFVYVASGAIKEMALCDKEIERCRKAREEIDA